MTFLMQIIRKTIYSIFERIIKTKTRVKTKTKILIVMCNYKQSNKKIINQNLSKIRKTENK